MRIHIFCLAAVLCFGTLVSSTFQPTGTTPPQTPFKKRPLGCDCFTVSGPDPGYFQHYKLWDFRSVDLTKHAHLNLTTPLPGSDGDWDDDDEGDEEGHSIAFTTAPPDGNQKSDPSSLVFFKTTFERDWSSQDWERQRSPIAPVYMVNSKNNVFLTKDYEREDPHATYLALRTTRHDNYTSTAEIETRVRNIQHCSLRVRLRVLPANFIVSQPPQPREWPPRNPQRHAIPPLNNRTTMDNWTVPLHEGSPPPGACAGIFTYHDRLSESDIEILTRDPIHRVRYANQPDYDPVADREIPGASTVADLPVPWTTWATHRLDWLSGMSRWFVNSQIQDSKTYRVPELESMIVLNLWSDGGVWTGDIKIGESIYMGIEYIELVYNRSTDTTCQNASFSQPDEHLMFSFANTSIIDDHSSDENSSDETLVCPRGRQGRKCRKERYKDRPHNEFCQRSCYIDGGEPWHSR
ncbi:hypothetical protein N7508_002921 [Penicillium antarcticum]|uniref:uncharacterized protein n=1 Tax=Penicillium antarcticum TaxID=416450 RepID=UPI00239CFB2E|nr:uncharacterized protein N7508_002921 [Penicillium antarcticum]KAJ5312091.1 hypothetical protein N7508_002921 [Penicillium antarcticum]